MPTAHSGHNVKHTMLSNDIFILFSEVLKKFEPISGQTTKSHLEELRKVLSQILLVILYDKENRVHNLVGIIQYPTTYKAD